MKITKEMVDYLWSRKIQAWLLDMDYDFEADKIIPYYAHEGGRVIYYPERDYMPMDAGNYADEDENQSNERDEDGNYY